MSGPGGDPHAGFAVAAGRLAGLAGVMFGWSPDRFWAATPDELAALVRVAAGEEAPPPADRAQMQRLMEAFPDGG